MKKMEAFFAMLVISGTSDLANSQKSVSKFKTANIDEKFITLNFIEDISFTATVSLPIKSSRDLKVLKEDLSKKVVDESTVNAIEKISARQLKYAMLMDVEVESIKDGSLFDFLEEWYGTRYRMGGTTKKEIDCSAFTKSLISAVYQFEIPRTAKEQYKKCEHLKKDD